MVFVRLGGLCLVFFCGFDLGGYGFGQAWGACFLWVL